MVRIAAALAGAFLVLTPLAVHAAHAHRPAVAAHATRITDPAAFIAEAYKDMAKTSEDPGPHAPPADIFTTRLAVLFALEQRERAKDSEGRLNIDFWSDGNGAGVDKGPVKVHTEDVEEAPGRCIVVVDFHSAGEAKELRFYFEKTAGRWLIDDVRIAGPDGWTLSLVLKYGDDRPVTPGAGFETPPKP